MMNLKNNSEKYGLVSRTIHWVSAIFLVSLFASGLWIDGLDYYSEWYRTAPNLHKSFGVVLITLTVLRLSWYRYTSKPSPLPTLKKGERVASIAAHHLMLTLIFIMGFSGYLITTAQGDSLEVFGLFSIPATLQGIDNLEDYAGEVHEITSFILIALACIHVAGALKHHFVDKDDTLRRMTG